MLSKVRYSSQPSAKRQTVDFNTSVRSLIWHNNRRGPRTVPCGTPESSLIASDSSPSTTIFICLLVKKPRSHELIVWGESTSSGKEVHMYKGGGSFH